MMRLGRGGDGWTGDSYYEGGMERLLLAGFGWLMAHGHLRKWDTSVLLVEF